MTLRLLLPAVALLLGFAAAPAHATWLVRSDGNGLLIQDKNGLSDGGSIEATMLDGRPAYLIENGTSGDIFHFDRQTGCEPVDNTHVKCHRNGPKINVALGAGRDIFGMELAPAGDASVTGGDGRDNIYGQPGHDSLNGGADDDLLVGNAGNDSLDGGLGEDRLLGLVGNDTLDGAENADRLEGGDGDDTLLGQGNADSLFGDKGDDVLRGGAGNDFIESREPEGTVSVDDAVDCGNGFDRVDADLKDSIQADCEDIDRRPVGETPNVKITAKTLRVSPSGQVKVRLRCPRGVKSLGCKGTLQLRLDARGARASRSRKVRYAIRAGRAKTVAVRLSAGDVRKLRRRRKTRGVLTSVEKGRKGLKTTIRNPRLRLR